jgi:predicted transposase YdaD
MAYEDREKARRDEMAKMFGAFSNGKKEGFQEGEMVGLQRGKLEGLREGEMLGLQKGQQEARIEIARNLIAENVNPKIIAQASGLSLEEVNALTASIC